MDNSILLLTLFAAVLNASWNLVIKLPKDQFLAMGGLCFFCAIISFCAFWFFSLLKTALWGYILASTVIHFIYKIFLTKAYQIGDFNFVYPISRGLSPLFFFLFTIIITSNNFQLKDILGIIIISITILLMHQNSFKKLLTFVFLIAICITSYSILDSVAVNQTSNIHSYIIAVFLLDKLLFFCFVFFKEKIYYSKI